MSHPGSRPSPETLILGEALLDLFPEAPGVSLGEASRLLPLSGGAPANLAVQLARLGRRVGLLTAVGDDPLSARIVAELAAAGVDTAGVVRLPGRRIGLTGVEVAADGERRFVPWREGSADQAFAPGHLDEATLAACRWLCHGTVSLKEPAAKAATEQAVAAVRGAGGRVVLDVNLRFGMFADRDDLLAKARAATPAAAVIKATREEGVALFGGGSDDELAEAFLETGAGLVLLTFGEEGALLKSRAGRARIDAERVAAVDATGAGDAFLGGSLATLSAWEADPATLDDRALEVMGRYAARLGGAAACRLGATPGMLTAAEAPVPSRPG